MIQARRMCILMLDDIAQNYVQFQLAIYWGKLKSKPQSKVNSYNPGTVYVLEEFSCAVTQKV